jgi:hypothetical protein
LPIFYINPTTLLCWRILMMNLNTRQIKHREPASKAIKKRVSGFIGIGLLALSGFAQAAFNFDFKGCNSGGCGAAEMAIDITGNVLTMTLDNTSPLTLQNGSSVNTPGITGFGFNLADTDPVWKNWSLTAHQFDKDGNIPEESTIGNDAGTGNWVLGGDKVSGITLDFIPTTKNGSNGALYNPDARDYLDKASPDSYLTQATLVVEFESAPTLAYEDCGSGIRDCNTFVRMQVVGKDGSLKLPGTPGTATFDTNNVPNPSPLALMGLGGILLGAISRRKRQQAFA